MRGALERRLGLPVIYNNDGNAAALYAHHVHFGADAMNRSSVSAIVGTGLGGGVVESGRVVAGAAGMAGELGHVHIPLDGLLGPGQPEPTCACGFTGDVGERRLADRHRAQPAAVLADPVSRTTRSPAEPVARAAKLVRGYGERGDALARELFDQQAMALGRLFTVAANFTDPHAYFVGGGVVEAAPEFRDWFLATVREHTVLREEQAAVATFALVPDRDMAGARGVAIAALEALRAVPEPRPLVA